MIQRVTQKASFFILCIGLSLPSGFTQELTGSPAAVKKVPVPGPEQAAAARKKVRDLYSIDLQLAKSPAQIWSLATKMGEAAAEAKNDAEAAYALSLEAIEVFITVGDFLSAFRLIDNLAMKVEINPVAQKLELYKRAATQAQVTPTKRMLAIVGLKLAGDATSAEDYTTAKEVAVLAADLAKATGDKTVVDRTNVQVQRCTDLSKMWQQVVDARRKLMTNNQDAAASETVGRYLCFVRQDWAVGLPLLAQSASPEYKPIATMDLATPKEAEAMAATADAWWKFTEAKKETEKREILPRVVYWYELSLPSLSGLTKVTAEKRLEAAYEALNGRDFKKLISAIPNGLRSAGILDCESKAHSAKIGPTFDYKKAWLVSFEFSPPNLAEGYHMVFFWGDGRGGRDPLYFRQEGTNLECHVEDTVNERVQTISTGLSADQVGKWVNVKLVHDPVSQELELYINQRLVRKDALAIMLRVDQKMGAVVGAITNGTEQRFTGKVRDVWFGNIK